MRLKKQTSALLEVEFCCEKHYFEIFGLLAVSDIVDTIARDKGERKELEEQLSVYGEAIIPGKEFTVLHGDLVLTWIEEFY